MPINSETITVVPPVTAAERTFPHLWLTEISIKSESLSEGELEISMVPYNANTQEIATDLATEFIRVENLWTAVSEVSAVEAAMVAIFDAIEPLKAWQASQ